MCNDTILPGAIRDEIHLSLDELARRGAQRMLAVALQAEVDEYIERHIGARDENGHALVVRNGRARERTVQCGAGELKERGGFGASISDEQLLALVQTQNGKRIGRLIEQRPTTSIGPPG